MFVSKNDSIRLFVGRGVRHGGKGACILWITGKVFLFCRGGRGRPSVFGGGGYPHWRLSFCRLQGCLFLIVGRSPAVRDWRLFCFFYGLSCRLQVVPFLSACFRMDRPVFPFLFYILYYRRSLCRLWQKGGKCRILTKKTGRPALFLIFFLSFLLFFLFIFSILSILYIRDNFYYVVFGKKGREKPYFVCKNKPPRASARGGRKNRRKLRRRSVIG